MHRQTPPTEPFDPERKFIRVTSIHARGFVEFEFSIGDPQLFVEMILPRAEFEQFCRDQHVQPTHGALPQAAAGSAEHEWDWSLRTAREQRFRRES
ncbi:MAG: phenol hydroxylase subunit [Rhodanobacter sp.]|jgi:phenol hydroxylase P0 protein|nr:phenol hydroxylase subunit [Rhodanobacter sp.]